jgi:hypothetical protein
MKHLEDTVSPFLKQLIDGGKTFDELTDAQAEALTRWAVKTGFVLGNAMPNGGFIPLEHALLVKHGGLPPGIALLGATSPTRLLQRTWSDRKWFGEARQELRTTIAQSCYKSTF